MTTCLFHFRRRVKTANTDEVVLNDNFIVPTSVTSFYWQENDGHKMLSVFLANGFTMTFTESTGNRFVEHMEDYLRYTIGGRTEAAPRQRYEKQHNNNQPRTARRAIETDDVVDEEPLVNQPASWEPN